MGFTVRGLGFKVHELGFGGKGLEVRVRGLRFKM